MGGGVRGGSEIGWGIEIPPHLSIGWPKIIPLDEKKKTLPLTFKML
jgi:hypothetical protein